MINNLYKLITIIYNYFFSLIENLFIKKKGPIQKSDLIENGFTKLDLDIDIKKCFSSIEIIKTNKYMDKYFLKKKNIMELIVKIFKEKKLSDKITSLTNFNYTIDFILAYKTYPINEDEQDIAWYANHWHKDKPFTKNMLKVIIPLKNILSDDDGGIELINKENSKLFEKERFIDETKIYKMKGETSSILLFHPNQCFHRAGKLKINNLPREQIMFQLNPSKIWRINNTIEEKQKKIEPKFPYFSYLNDKKINIEEI